MLIMLVQLQVNTPSSSNPVSSFPIQSVKFKSQSHLSQLSTQKLLSKPVFWLRAKQIDRAVYYFLEGDLAFLLWIRDLVLRILACLTGI